MWRQITPDNLLRDIWGRQFKLANYPYGTYEELASYPFEHATTLANIKEHPWPDPDWWDFSNVPDLIDQMDEYDQYHIRYRIGSIFEVAKSFGLKVMYHCDGAIYPLIPDLIDLGVDVLNPIQSDAEGMDPAGLKEQFGDKLCFHGGIDIIETLPHGSASDVRREVKTRIKDLGSQGGYVLAGTHHIQADTPLENIQALYEPDLRKAYEQLNR